MKLKLLTTCVLIATSNIAIAQDTVTKPKTAYEEMVTRLDDHPVLEAVRQQVIQQKEASIAAGALPDPMLVFGINNYPADGTGDFDRFAMTSKSIGFVQSIPNSGIRSASVVEKQVLSKKAKLAVSFTRQKLFAALNAALANKKRVKKQHSLVQQDKGLLRQESAYWDGRLQAGESVLDERSRVEAELAGVEARLATLNAEMVQYEEELKRLVGGVGGSAPSKQTAMIWPTALELYPVLLSEMDVHVARAKVDGAESALGSNYQFGMTYSQRDNSGEFDGGDFVSAKVGVSIPLWASKSQKPKLRSAQAGVRSAQATYEDVKSQWQQRLATQYAKIKETQVAQKALALKEKSIQTQINSLRGAYEADGRLDVLISAKRNLIDLKLKRAELDARYVEQVSAYNSVFQKEGSL